MASPLELAFVIPAAAVAGCIDAVAGGGGLVTLPAILAAGVSPHQALGTNKAQSIFGTAAALTTYARAGRVDARWARWTFPLGVVGSALGARAVLAVPKDTLRVVVIALLAVAATVLALRRRRDDAPADGRPVVLAIPALIALVIGAYDGFFGPGTGTFLIVAFSAWCGRRLDAASADAKVVNLASNLAALTVFASRGDVRWGLALPMAAAQIVGGAVGARIALKGGARLVRVVALGVTAALIVKLAIDVV